MSDETFGARIMRESIEDNERRCPVADCLWRADYLIYAAIKDPTSYDYAPTYIVYPAPLRRVCSFHVGQYLAIDAAQPGGTECWVVKKDEV